MRVSTNFEGMTHDMPRYETPAIGVVEVAIERGFEASNEDFEGPAYDEEDVIW